MTTKIGVLGGVGPESTGEFYNKLISEMQDRGMINSNKDYPQVVINSVPAPELIYDRISDDELKPYIDAVKELDQFDVDFIVMVCNTIHYYFDRLQEEISTPILDLRKELKNHLNRLGVRSALVMGTPNTVREGLYSFDSLKSHQLSEDELDTLSDVIFKYNRGIDKEEQKEKVKEICEKHLDDGVKTIVLTGTEFAVMLKDEDFPTINIIDVLVNSTIREYTSREK